MSDAIYNEKIDSMTYNELIFTEVSVIAATLTLHGAAYAIEAGELILPDTVTLTFTDAEPVTISVFHDYGASMPRSKAPRVAACGFHVDLPFRAEPFGRLISVTAMLGGKAKIWSADDFQAKRHRWLFAPTPLAVADFSLDIRNYPTRIKDRNTLFDYTKHLAQSIIGQDKIEKDPIAICQVAAVIIYRLLDQPARATPENINLVRAMIEHFKANEAVAPVHWRLSIRYAYAQIMLRHGFTQDCIEALEEMQPLGPLTRESYISIYNYVKSCLLLGSIQLLLDRPENAKHTFKNAIDLSYFCPSVAPKKFSMARELSDVFMSCALCMAGIEAARSKPYETAHFKIADAIRSTLRFKNKVQLQTTVALAAQLFQPSDVRSD